MPIHGHGAALVDIESNHGKPQSNPMPARDPVCNSGKYEIFARMQLAPHHRECRGKINGARLRSRCMGLSAEPACPSSRRRSWAGLAVGVSIGGAGAVDEIFRRSPSGERPFPSRTHRGVRPGAPASLHRQQPNTRSRPLPPGGAVHAIGGTIGRDRLPKRAKGSYRRACLEPRPARAEQGAT